MDIQIITAPIDRKKIQEIAEQQFGDLVKAVVDIEKRVMAIGGELHSDEEVVLMENGSEREHTWGINLYPQKTGDEWIEFDSMINIKPQFNNRSRGIENQAIQGKIRLIVAQLVI